MAQKYHLTPDGPKPCKANVRACRYGHHFANIEDAQRASDKAHELELRGRRFDYYKKPPDDNSSANPFSSGLKLKPWEKSLMETDFGTGTVKYKLRKMPTLKDKIKMVVKINEYDGSFEDMVYENCDNDFYKKYFSEDPIKLAKAIENSKHFNCKDPYVRYDSIGYLESADIYKRERELNQNLNNILTEYSDLMASGAIEEDNIFYKVESEVKNNE